MWWIGRVLRPLSASSAWSPTSASSPPLSAVALLLMLLLQFPAETLSRPLSGFPELPEVVCVGETMKVMFTGSAFGHGHVFVVGHEPNRRCVFPLSDGRHVDIPILHCCRVDDIDDNGLLRVSAYIRASPHPTLITSDAQTFRLECNGVERRALLEEYVHGPVNTVCRHETNLSKMPPRLGDLMFHEWTCSEQYGFPDFHMWISECAAVSRNKDVVPLIAESGCWRDEDLLNNLHSSISGAQKVTALSRLFKFPDDEDFRIRTKILLVPKLFNNISYASVDFARLPGSIETVTLTDWIQVKEETENIMVEEFDRNEIADTEKLLHSQVLDVDDTDEVSASIFKLFNETLFNLTGDEDWAQLLKPSARQWRLDDIVLNRSNQSITMVMCNRNRSRYEMIVPFRKTYRCSWHSLNTTLLLWGIACVLIWMVQLAYLFYTYLAREFRQPAGVDGRRAASSASLSRSWSEPYRLNRALFCGPSDYLEFGRPPASSTRPFHRT